MIKSIFSHLAFLFILFPVHAMETYGISKPSAEVAMGFTAPGRVARVAAAAGKRVRVGEVIAELDGRVLDARIQQVTLEAESTAEVDAAKAELAQREQELKKIAQVHERGAATDLERERAELEVIIGRLKVVASEEKRTMASYRLQELRAERALLYMVSPIDGVIEKLHIETGESPQTMEPVVLVVNCDPLWVEAPVPLATAAKLRVGDEIGIVYPDGSRSSGTAAVISLIADSASETVLVRVDVPNPEWRRAGERVGVVVSL